MRGRNTSRMWVAAVAAIGVAACTDLGAVRDFAQVSAETGSYRAIVDSWEAHPTRMARYRPQSAALFAAQRAEREAQRDGLLALQEALTTYMASLGRLAADEAVTFRTATLAQAATKAGVFGANATGAVTALSDLLLRAGASAWRQREVAQVIGAANAPLQEIVAAARTFVREGVAAQDEAERAAIAFFYGSLERGSGDRAARQAVREWRELRDREVSQQAAAREAYLKALEAIGRGHQVLHDHRDRLSVEETTRQVRAVEAELRVLAAQLRPLLPSLLPI